METYYFFLDHQEMKHSMNVDFLHWNDNHQATVSSLESAIGLYSKPKKKFQMKSIQFFRLENELW